MKDKKTAIAVVVAVAVIALLFGGANFLITLFTGQSGNNQEQSQVATQEDQIQSEDTVVGTGTVATIGSTVTVNYVGVLSNGQKFDSSYDRGQPFSFTLGAGQVIKGWDEGLVGMKVGGTRILVIPPSLGYGAQDYGPIPANSTLIFQVELLDVK